MKTLFLQPQARLGDKLAAEVVIRRYKDQFGGKIFALEYQPEYISGLSIDFIDSIDEHWKYISGVELRNKYLEAKIDKIIVLHSSPPQSDINHTALFYTSPDGQCWGTLKGTWMKNAYFVHVFSALKYARQDNYLYRLNVEPKNPIPRSKKLKIAYHRRNVSWQTERNIPDHMHNKTIIELKKLGSVWEIKKEYPNVKDLAAHIKGCDLFVGCESGPTHVAAAVGVPFVGAHFYKWSYESHPLGNGIILTRPSDKQFNTVSEIIKTAKKVVR